MSYNPNFGMPPAMQMNNYPGGVAPVQAAGASAIPGGMGLGAMNAAALSAAAPQQQQAPDLAQLAAAMFSLQQQQDTGKEKLEQQRAKVKALRNPAGGILGQKNQGEAPNWAGAAADLFGAYKARQAEKDADSTSESLADKLATGGKSLFDALRRRSGGE